MIFSFEIDNIKEKKNNTKNYIDNLQYSNNIFNLDDTTIKKKYDYIEESFSNYDENSEYIQKQNDVNKSSIIMNNLYSYLNNSTLYIKSFVKNND